ncbi:hypothetical protein MMC07_000257 [Pseudocyphellaria aurata]|nr:hypothetical protein [Pseudocyphellaria aurata]
MIFRGSRLSHLRQPCPVFCHRGPYSFYAERVPAPSSTFLGRCTSGLRDHGSYITPISRRNYADKPVSRPKAHTGRTAAAPSKKAATTTEVTVKTTSTRGKKSPTKSKRKPKSKTKAKTASRTRAKAKRKPRTRTRKILTEAQKEKLAAAKAKRKERLAAQKSKQKIAELKAAALEPPKPAPSSVYLLVHIETSREMGPGANVGERARRTSTRYHGLSPERREHYNRILIEKKAAAKAAYRQWIESHTPDQIRLANHARALLHRRGMRKYSKLDDERQVKKHLTGYIFFSTERHASGAYAGISLPERAKLLSQEWKALTAAEKKKFEDMESRDIQRHIQEMKTVYNVDVSPKPPKAVVAAAA